MTPKYPGKSIIWLAAVLMCVLFLLSKPSLGTLADNPILSLAQICALLGTALFATSFMIASRAKIIEEAFGGLDRAYRVHHKTGVWSFSLLVVHLASVFIAYGSLGSPIGRMMVSNLTFITGEIAILGMAAIILVIIFAKIKYQYFVIVQKFFAIPYAVGVYHLYTTSSSSDVSRYAPLRLYLTVFLFLGAIAWIWREIFYKHLAPHAIYEVKTVKSLPAGITEITLTPKGAPLNAEAGQFAYFSFRKSAVSSEPHPFSFTSAPGSADLSFAAKALGDYTSTLGQAKPGDEVAVYGPYGKFFSEMDPAAGNVFVAGGIGITPFLSALRDGKNMGNTTLFYTTRSETDRAFNDELERIAEQPAAFRYHYHGSDQRGFLNVDIVEKRAGGLEGKKIYLCGPVPMMRALTEGFVKKGVPRSNIIFEAFSY